MGSLARVTLFYTDLEEFLNKTTLPIYGALMNGKNVYSVSKKEDAILVMGNEANGVSKKIEKLITHTITIPKYNKDAVIDSLNVATATAILLNEFRRN
jgi:TrmH family RNA methyltransferase